MLIVLASGWVSDDAFITLRTSRRLLGGEGFVWNPAERVQVFTHPLWALLLTLALALVGSMFWGALLLALTATGAALAVLARHAPSPTSAALAVLGLGLSRWFVDFSTSGLENPLLHLLLLALLLTPYGRKPRGASVLVGLALLTRLDVAPLFLAVLAGTLWRHRAPLLAALPFALGPALLWMVGSLLWFGALLPNPALAKLGAGVPRGAQLVQGGWYLLDSARFDPLGASLLVAGLLVALVRPGWRALGLGLVLQLAWVAQAGGDFMFGRFLTVPLVGAVAALAALPLRSWTGALAVAAGVVGLSLLEPLPTLGSPTAGVVADPGDLIGEHGVADERSYYTPGSAVVGWRPGVDLPQHPFRSDGEAARHREVISAIGVGLRGAFARGDVWVEDPVGVTEPLLARLPAREGQRRPGHLRRRSPAGYEPGPNAERCALDDQTTAALCRDLWLATRAPLGAEGRAAAILRILRGDLGQILFGERGPTR